MEYCSVIKRNETVSFAETWMGPKIVIQSEVSLKDNNKYCVLTHICGIWKNAKDYFIWKAEIDT